MAIETVSHQAHQGFQVNRQITIILSVLAAMAVVQLVPGHIATTRHVIDLMHSTTIALRIAAGDQQHIDFMTPLGIMTTAPIGWLIAAGLDVARAYLAAGLLVALALLPAVFRVASSRLSPGLGTAFGVAIVFLATGLIYGGG